MQILKDNVKQNILEAACGEFFNNTYKSASMRIIAQKSGITVGNLYRYFSNKADILETLLSPIESSLSEFSSKMLEPIVGGDIESIFEMISSQIAPHTDFLSQYRREIVILLEKAEGTRYQIIKEQLLEQITEHIFEHFASQDIDYSSPEIKNTGLGISESFLAGLVTILKKSEQDSTIKRALQNYLHFFIYGFIHTLQDFKK